MRVNCEHWELRLLEVLWVLVGRLLEENAKSSLEVYRQAGGILAAKVQTVGKLEGSRLHNHRFGGRAQHVAGDQLKADEAARVDAVWMIKVHWTICL